MLVMVTVESGPRHHIRLITIMQRVEAVSAGTKTNGLSPRVKLQMAESQIWTSGRIGPSLFLFCF
ncbi:hypothetical protein NC651_024587 [Populus alba x Populus x berolinensis]|nr:hypothetical protein NC651_024587 [Populus alba x Populus x berolinensis]